MKKLLPIRIKLTLWYVLFLGVILFAFSILIYMILSAQLHSETDSSLRIVSSQLLANIEIVQNYPVFKKTVEMDSLTNRLLAEGFAVRLMDNSGSIVEGFGPFGILKASIDLTDKEFSSVSTSVGVWRIFTLQIGQWGWIQVGESLSSVRVALFRLSRLMMLIGPTIIILAVVGGFYLAKKSLEPVERITLLAEEISVEKLNKRLNLTLPDDELGHLASTFDGMLERLEESVKKQRQFTSDAAHELRTPLTAIRSIVDVTLHRDRSSEEYVSALLQIQNEIERLSSVIDDLLIITRLENTLPKREFAVFSVSALIWEVLETMMVLAKEKNIEIETDLQENLEIAGDRKHLSRAVFNLVDNAIKYTPENGKIRIAAKLSESKERIEIIVEDNGIGIQLEDMERIFDRFYRVDRARSQTRGTGLGLSIAKEIVKAHGGVISVKSSPGKGSTFKVSLPSKIRKL
ncbi:MULTISPECIES: ATP-binding protein [Mesotoga]|jgi:heavy metal sensor kinase|uniref:sensor histidine kinase n=1 Tax=Mesotoga TaxID=1184396 RepID=UPI0002C9A289|nr:MULTISPECIES: ATP-binding protein [Mesotoga]MCP5457426.1 HAMP domain-containing protein [Thermotogota bacterium]CCU83627.1 Integral membrane sensor signal transduction histidine kinase [Mesotoga infera]MCP5460792.1 HAMP domain-containing protein [Thermotogota bacterium]MDK2944960.1 two-component system, OmpR family, sensor kinase [Mesotoga sp.]RLL86035.1 histidine kinase [Mesotoga sp. H07pep.5.4]